MCEMYHPDAVGGQDVGCIAPNGLGCNHSARALGGQAGQTGWSGRNANPSGANTFFADDPFIISFLLCNHCCANSLASQGHPGF